MTEKQIKELVTLCGEVVKYDNHFKLTYELVITDKVKFEYNLSFYSNFKGIIGLGFDKYGNETLFTHDSCVRKLRAVLAQCVEMKLKIK